MSQILKNRNLITIKLRGFQGKKMTKKLKHVNSGQPGQPGQLNV